MISHRNIIYSAFAYAEGCGVLERHFEAVCYLPCVTWPSVATRW